MTILFFLFSLGSFYEGISLQGRAAAGSDDDTIPIGLLGLYRCMKFHTGSFPFKESDTLNVWLSLEIQKKHPKIING